MKEKELRDNATCSVCDNPIGRSVIPLFWTVTVERHAVKLETIRRQDGLAAMFGGNSALAQVMGTDAEMTQTVLGPIKLVVCESCAHEQHNLIHVAMGQ